MNTDMDENPVKVFLDTNILISALGFGGRPRQILQLVLDNKIKSVTSPVLFAEFEDVVTKKFPILSNNLERIKKQIRENFEIVRPRESLRLVRDDDDNRVLEVAVEGKCQYIITGDKDLLVLKKFKKIAILTPAEFLRNFG